MIKISRTVAYTALLLCMAMVSLCPTVFGASHIAIRKFMIESHLGQMKDGSVLLIGDSVVEGWLIASINGCPVINGGLGGGG